MNSFISEVTVFRLSLIVRGGIPICVCRLFDVGLCLELLELELELELDLLGLNASTAGTMIPISRKKLTKNVTATAICSQ